MKEILIPKLGAVRWTVPGSYGDQKIGGNWSWVTFDQAVAAARSEIHRFDYPGQNPDHTYSRAFVALRVEADCVGGIMGCGTDREILRFEVFRDRVALVPQGQGGLSDEQKAQVLGKKLTRRSR